MLTHKGYSLIMWTVTFAALLAATAIVQVPLKRALNVKARSTAAYVFWSSWDNDPQTEPTETTSRAKGSTDQNITNTTYENHAGEIWNYTKNIMDEGRVSTGVERGSESLLDFDGVKDLNTLK